MRALSYRNPWPFALLFMGKDVENRVWRTNVTGPVLIHASMGCTTMEYTEALAFMVGAGADISKVPRLRDLPKGGIVGVLTFAGKVLTPNSLELFLRDAPAEPWWMDGRYGHRVTDARPLPFIPCRGFQRWFDVPDELLEAELGPRWRDVIAGTATPTSRGHAYLEAM